MGPLSLAFYFLTRIVSYAVHHKSIWFLAQLSVISIRNSSHKSQVSGKKSSRGNTNTHMNPTCGLRLSFTLCLLASSVGLLQSNHPILLSYAPLTVLCQIGSLWTQGKVSTERWDGELQGVRAVGPLWEGMWRSEENAVSSIPIRGEEKGRRASRERWERDNKSRCQEDTEYASRCNVSKNISLMFMPRMAGRERKQR